MAGTKAVASQLKQDFTTGFRREDNRDPLLTKNKFDRPGASRGNNSL